MGHALIAVVTPKPVDAAAAAALDLTVLDGGSHAILPLYPAHLDAWTEKLGLSFEHESQIIGDMPVLQAFAERLGLRRFALIQTEYFGGQGSQWATAWNDGLRICPAREGPGAINAALVAIGVAPDKRRDAFDTVGLGRYRDGSVFFEDYWR